MAPASKKPLIELPDGVRRVRAKGRDYFYYHPHRGTDQEKKAIRLPGTPHDQDFWDAYHKASDTREQQDGLFSSLIRDYQKSPEFKAKAPKTAKEYSRYFEIIRHHWGHLPVVDLRPRNVLELRDLYAETPAKSNYLIRSLSLLISWGIPRGYETVNPCSDIPKFKVGTHVPWPAEAIKYFSRHARKEMWEAAALALYSGQRQGDVLKMQWKDIKDDLISVKQDKTKKLLVIPVHSELREVLDKVDRNSDYILTNSRKTPWSSGFKASWTKQMAQPEMTRLKEAGLVFHGLRKSAVVILLEAGCTDAQVGAVTGQTRQMVEYYSVMVNQGKLAREAMLKWDKS
ncbi:MAG: hypothetical protein DSY80_06350 [Desulfocapsa sp.]|nr:MAG: hypothetical protein DSY80_06350 [Desulfocapsa sp.]